MNWTEVSRRVTERVLYDLDGAPTSVHPNGVIVQPRQLEVIVTGKPRVFMVIGEQTAGKGRRDGGMYVKSYTRSDAPDWVLNIVDEAFG